MDIKSAYPYGKLNNNEHIYLRPPEHVTIPGLKPGQVLKLNVALYGLKQAGRRWYNTFRAILEDKLNFTRSEHDNAVFYRHLKDQSVQIIFTHVDDTTLITPNDATMHILKGNVKKYLEVTDGGELHWLLGIEVIRDRTARTLSLSQKAYIDSIISRYPVFDNSQRSKSSIPFDPAVVFSKEDEPRTPEDIAYMRKLPYREALGALMYCAVATRPDISYAVSQLSRYSTNPGRKHWSALCKVYAYLNQTRNYRLTYGHDTPSIHGFSDADGMSSPDRHAISGYVFMIDGGAVSWSSKRQELVTLSTTEAEYVALTHATKEAIWLQNLLSEIFTGIDVKPFPLHSDNMSAIALARDDRYHARTKHIDIRFHFIRYSVEDGKIKLIFCPTASMTADIFTKALPSVKAKHFAMSMGLRSV